MSKKCIYCGALLEDDDMFCDECGKKQEKTAESGGKEDSGGPGNEKKKKKPALPVVIAVAAALVCIFVAGGSLLSSKDKEADSPRTSAQSEDRTSSSPKDSKKDRTEARSEEKDSGGKSSSSTSEAELLEYIDQAEEVYSDAYDKIHVLADEEEDFVERSRKQCEIVETLLSDLSKLQQQAESVSGIDANLKTAGLEYFNMMSDSQNAVLEIWTFLADYLDFCEAYLDNRPRAEDYTSTEEYYNAFYPWYQNVKEGYAAVDSCPPCLEIRWKQYETILDLNDSISRKLYLSVQYDDPLRYQSAQNMIDRYDTVEMLRYSEFLDSLEGEQNHYLGQRSLSSKLAQEIHTYSEMDEKERDGYEFEYVRTGKISINYDTVDTIYPSLYNSYDAFLVIKTGCASGTRKILVEAEIPGFTQNYKETFTLDSAYTEIYVKPPALTGDLNLSAAKDAQINVTVSNSDGTLIEAKTFPVTIKSKYDFEWYSDEYGVATKDNILCFLTPEAPAISELKRLAIDHISSITNGQMESFVGYQNTKWNNHYVGTYLQAAGIMRALYESGVRYNMDSFSLSGSNQHILFPEEVLEQKSGLCIETSLVVASALQSAGMHVFLIFPPGHAQVAVEVWNGSGDDATGTGNYFLIETTALSEDSNNQSVFEENANALLDYKNAGTGPITYYNHDSWRKYLTDDTYVIDCGDSGTLGLTPFAN